MRTASARYATSIGARVSWTASAGGSTTSAATHDRNTSPAVRDKAGRLLAHVAQHGGVAEISHPRFRLHRTQRAWLSTSAPAASTQRPCHPDMAAPKPRHGSPGPTATYNASTPSVPGLRHHLLGAPIPAVSAPRPTPRNATHRTGAPGVDRQSRRSTSTAKHPRQAAARTVWAILFGLSRTLRPCGSQSLLAGPMLLHDCRAWASPMTLPGSPATLVHT